MWKKRENNELSKSLKQIENQAKESDDAPQAYFLFSESEKTLKSENALRGMLLNGPNAKLSNPERGSKLWKDVNGKAERS
jgi:hypothetical protein